MDVLESAIADYEDVLVGKKRSMSGYYFSYNAGGNMKLALSIMRYAFDTYLKWPAEQLRDCLTPEIMQRFKLQALIRYIAFPPELNNKTDMFYIVWLLYPATVHFNEIELVLRIYKDVLSKKLPKYPKEFFDGRSGIYRAQVCLRYAIEQTLQFNSVEGIYEYFISPQCTPFLRQQRLLLICKELFDSPLAFLHTTLPKEQQSDFLYYYYDFKQRRAIQQLKIGEPLTPAAAAGDPT